MRDRDLFRGCLVGGAAGDALGYAVEFKGESEIFRIYGMRGITEYSLRSGTACFSDDTQMTLFTAAGLLAGGHGGGSFRECVNRAYLDWLRTQKGKFPPEGGTDGSELLKERELYICEEPGNTCLSALEAGGNGSVDRPINQSKGCGGVMRVAPIGLYFNDRKDRGARDAARLGAEAAALTHGHPLAWLPAAALAQIIHEISQDRVRTADAVSHALSAAAEMWPDTEHLRYFTGLIEKAADLASGELGDLDAIHRLGEGWVAEETLAIAVFCALRYEGDIDRALIASVNHRGDSDSTGAVTGNIVGAQTGFSAIPEKYTRTLKRLDLILAVADGLWRDDGGIWPRGPRE